MTTRKRTVPREPFFDLMYTAAEYLLNRSARERTEYNERTLKAQLMGHIEANGEQVTDTKQAVELEEPLQYVQMKDGRRVDKVITGFERRKRVSTHLNEEATMGFLLAKGLLDECTETTVVIKESAILAANYEGRITDAELAALYVDDTTFAFYLVEE